MVRLIFIFSNILVLFLTIVSKNAFCDSFTVPAINETDVRTDTIIPIFSADFESGNLTGWKQTNDWEVSTIDKISGASSLKHSSKATGGYSAIFHSFGSDLNSFEINWLFKLKNGNWDPSLSNRFWFYLNADTIRTDLINGWAVVVNITNSNDLLELWRIRNGKADSLIVQTDLDWNASTQAEVSVRRSVRGVWTLQYQVSGEAKSKVFSGSDPTVFPLKNIGTYFNFTSTRAGQLWIDDISVTKNSSELFIQKITLINSTTISIAFNKALNQSSIHAGIFRLTDELNQNIAVTKVSPTKNSDKSIDVSFGKTSGIEIHSSISGISDLSGKVMNPDNRTISYSFSPEPGSILINEVLFNPFTGGVDFVELTNVSETSVPVHRLKLATRNDTLALKQIYPVSTEKSYLKPDEFLVCTKDPVIVVSQYITNNSARFCTMKSFPTFPDDAGIVVLLNDSLEVMDEFSYLAKMHSSFLADEEGVSLERISFEKPTNDRTNWTSAAASVGFATPGLTNSQAGSEIEIQDEITPEPKAFSPNGDGYNDELTIQFKFSKPGYICNVRIFDVAGRQVRFLVKNELLAQNGSWQWDGKSESGQKLGIGVYIILVEVFDQEGRTKAFKKICTLTDRLD